MGEPTLGRSDEELARAAARGSEEAFRELVGRFERPVYGLIVRIVRDAATAEDLAQETFLKAYRALATFDPSRKLSSWLFKIAHNTALDQLRRHGLETESLDEPGPDGETPAELPADPSAENPFDRVASHEMGRALERALAGLRPRYREILMLRFAEELSYEEIAEILGAPLGTVKIHLFRARQELARRMEEAGWRVGAT